MLIHFTQKKCKKTKIFKIIIDLFAFIFDNDQI